MNTWPYLFLAAITLAGCSDVVTSRFKTLAEARADSLFERGWLPDFLPSSSIDIVTRNNLDLGTSVGEFSFVPADGQRFYNKLSPGAPVRTGFANWSEMVAGYSERKYSAWSYHDGPYTWAFFCKKTHDQCEYFLEYTRQDPPNVQ